MSAKAIPTAATHVSDVKEIQLELTPFVCSGVAKRLGRSQCGELTEKAERILRGLRLPRRARG